MFEPKLLKNRVLPDMSFLFLRLVLHELLLLLRISQR